MSFDRVLSYREHFASHVSFAYYLGRLNCPIIVLYSRAIRQLIAIIEDIPKASAVNAKGLLNVANC